MKVNKTYDPVNIVKKCKYFLKKASSNIVDLSIVIFHKVESITGILIALINEESGHGSDITQGVSWFLTNFPIFYILHDIPQIV